jgi:hypothetical protein
MPSLQTRDRQAPRFFIPSPHPHEKSLPGSEQTSISYISPILGSCTPSQHLSSTFLASSQQPQKPTYSRRESRHSRSSISALASALQSYHVAPDKGSTKSLHTPPLGIWSSEDPTPEDQVGMEKIGDEMMDAVVEIHRVLYRGREDWAGSGITGWDVEREEVERVVQRWFEGDCGTLTFGMTSCPHTGMRFNICCPSGWASRHRRTDPKIVYDHPLLRISSRQSLLTHHILLHLLSTLYLPAITPQSLVYHIGTLASLLRDQAIGSRWDSQEKADVEAGKVDDVEWSIRKGRRGQMAKENEQSRWWRLWEVSAECMDIGGMECYGKSSADVRGHVS